MPGSYLIYSILAIVVTTLWFYWKLVARLDYWKKRGVAYIPASPIYGNAKDALLMNKSEAEVLQSLYNNVPRERYVGIFRFNMPCLLLRDPDLIKSVLVKDFGNFTDRGFKVDEKRNPLGAHLFSLGGRKWQNLRVKLTPTFTSGKMKMMFPLVTECAEKMLKKLEIPAKEGDIIEMKEIIAQLTTDIIGSCAFGLQLNTLDDPESPFRKHFRQLFTASSGAKLLFIVGTIIPGVIPLLRKFFVMDVHDFFIKFVTDTVKYREDNNIHRNDFLQLLIELKNKGHLDSYKTKTDEEDILSVNHEIGSTTQDTHIELKNKGHLDSYQTRTDEEDILNVNHEIGSTTQDTHIVFTDALLAAQCFVFFAAGFETSSIAASFCLHELAMNPNIQDKLRKEIDEVTKTSNGILSYEALQKMKYLDHVISETLRKYPPLPRLDRECVKTYKIPGTDTVIEKGTKVVVPTYALHHDPKYYPNPERFDPERFNDKNKNSIHPYTYLPFGEGPRLCIGMRFGLMQTKMAIASLLSKYKFSVCSETQDPPVLDPHGLMLHSMDGIWLKISPR